MGGVLNLIPRRGSPVPVTEFVGQGGTFQTGSAALSHGRMLGPVDLFLSLSGSTTNGYLENSRGDAVDWETQSVFSNTGYEGKKLGLRVYGGFFHGSGTDEDFNRDLNRNLEDVGLWVRGARPETETRLRLYRSALNQTLDWFARPAADNAQSSLGAILTQTHRLLPDHLVTGGLEWRLEEATVDELAGTVDRDATTWAGFLQDGIEVSDAWDVVVGVRFDVQGETEAFSYRAGANYRPAPGTILRASVGRAFRVPTISDRFLPTTPFFGVTFEGNPDLDPEALVSAEAGVSWEMIGGRVQAGVTGFATRARDFFDFLLQPDDVFRPENIARVSIHGIEAQVLADLGSGFEAAGSYTYTNAYYDQFVGNEGAEGNRLDDNVLHQGAISVAYRGQAGHAVRLIVTACGDRFTDPENTPAGRLSPFVVADIALSVPLGDKLVATMQVQNLTDTSYRTRIEFRQPGRTVTAGLRALF
jgi:outer membrane receptor protein involved in Fe transport